MAVEANFLRNQILTVVSNGGTTVYLTLSRVAVLVSIGAGHRRTR